MNIGTSVRLKRNIGNLKIGTIGRIIYRYCWSPEVEVVFSDLTITLNKTSVEPYG